MSKNIKIISLNNYFQKSVDIIKRNFWIIILLLIFIGLRLINISSEEFWYDEYFNLLIAKNIPFQQWIPYIATSQHPPFYYVLMKPIMLLFGINELTGRLPALLFSILALLTIIKIVRLITNNKYILFMILITITFSSLNIEYSQEARPYTLLLFEYLLLFYMILISIKNKYISPGYFLVITIVAALALYTHYLMIVYLTALILSLTYQTIQHKEYRYLYIKLILSLFIALFLFSPWLILIPKYSLQSNAYFAVEQSHRSFLYLISGLTYFNFFKFSLLFFLISLTIFCSFIINIYKNSIIKNNALIKLPVITILITIVLIYISPLMSSYTDTWQRHLININAVFIIIYIILLIEYINSSYLKIFAVIMLFLVSSKSILMVLSNDTMWHYFHQHKKIVKYIEKNEIKGDIIIVSRPMKEVMIARYYRNKNKLTNILGYKLYKNGLPSIQSLQATYLNNNYFRDINYKKSLDKYIHSYNRFWVVNNYSYEDRYLLKYFQNKPDYKITNIKEFDNSRLLLIEKK